MYNFKENDYVGVALNYLNDLINSLEKEYKQELKNGRSILETAVIQHQDLLDRLNDLVELNLKSSELLNARSKQSFRDLKDPLRDNLDN